MHTPLVYISIFAFFLAFFLAIFCLYSCLYPLKKAKKDPSFARLLDYEKLLDNNCILLKNGSFLKIYKVQIDDFQNLEEEKIALHQELIARAFNELKGEFTVHFDVVRTKLRQGGSENYSYHGPKVFEKLFFERSKKHTECYCNQYFLSLSKKVSTLSSLNLKNKASLDDKLQEFLESSKAFALKLSNSLKLSECTYLDNLPLKSHESVNFLKFCINQKEINLLLPMHDFYLDTLLSSDDFYPGLTPRLSDQYIAVVAIDTLPNVSNFGILNELATLDFKYRLSTRFISFDNLKANILIERKRRIWQQQKRGLIAQLFNLKSKDEDLNDDAKEQLQDIKLVKKELAASKVSYGAYSANVVLTDSNLEALEYKALEVLKKLNQLGFDGRIESYNATDAYLGTLPGHSFENVRQNTISNSVLSDLLPLNANCQGQSLSPNQKFFKNEPYLMAVSTFDKQLYYLNLHVQDLGNTLVVGPPGSGKSVLLGSLIISLLRYKNMKIFAFEKGGSFYALTKACSGNHIVLDEGNLSFCPICDLSSPYKRSKAVDFILFLMELCGLTHPHLVKEQVENAISTMASLYQDQNKSISLSDVNDFLCDTNLSSYLEPYLSSKNGSALLDGRENPDYQKHITTFEIGNFFSKNQKDIQAILYCIFMQIDEAILKNEASAIVIDEAWLMLLHQEFSDKLLEWFKTLRKYNVTIILATQSISDLESNCNFEKLLDTIKTKIYLPNADAKSNALFKIYNLLNLNPRQIDLIAKATPKQDLFLQQQGQFVPFRLLLSTSELNLLSKTYQDKAQIDALYDTYQEQMVWKLS